MKLLYKCILLISIALASCSDNYEEELGLYPTLVPRYISVSPTTFTFEAKTSNKKSLKILSTQTPWNINCAVDWLTLSTRSGVSSASVLVGAEENKSGDDARIGVFYVSSNVDDWKYETPITVTQAGAQPYITPSQNEFDLLGNANDKSFSISTNCSWEVKSNSSWLVASKKNGNVKFTTTANETTDYRNAIITIYHTGTKNVASNVVVRQAPATITSSTDTLIFNNTAGTAEITINSEASWSASSSSSWMEISPSSGNAGTSIMNINVSPNTSTSERTGYVILSIGNNQRIQIPVRQRGIYIEVDKTTLTFKSRGESHSISIASNTNWVINDIPNWITVSPTEGNGDANVTITTEDNMSAYERSAALEVTQDGVTIGNTITIIQEGKFFDVSAQSASFDDMPSSQTLEVQAEDAWNIQNSTSWINISQMSGSGTSTINISVDENETEDSRQGIVYITMLDKTIQVLITQKGKVFSADVDTKSVVFPASGGTSTLEVTSNTNWNISNYPSWITLSQTAGKGNISISITATENTSADERVGSMLLKIDGTTTATTIEIKQNGKSISITPTELVFTSNASTQDVNITSDGKWDAKTMQSWITITPANGDGNSILKVSVTENMSVNQRSGVVSISMGGKNITLPITQSCKSFGVTPMSLSFEDKSSTQNIAIETDGAWTASTTDSWISLSPSSASGNSVLIVTVTENTTNLTRNGSISVTMGDKTINVSVSQKGKYLTINNTDLTYTSKGGTIDITVSTNDSWTAITENNSTWISISQTSGSGTANIKVTAADNPSVNSRSEYVIIETPHGQNVRVLLRQDARYLTIDNNNLMFYSKGGTSEAITVSTDGTYSVTTSQSWLSINQSANTFTVTASENSGTDTRFGKIVIALTDLQEGTYSLTLDVTQLNYGGSFLRKDYDDDHNWDNMGNSIGNLTITGFGSDNNYDTNTASGTTLSISGYKSDKNWDESSSSGVKVTITGYNPDKNLDSQTNSSGTISKQEYGTDYNWQ